eukprot:scaffold138092_cov19-Prasinocladus_malaysianus.AAC.1
MESHHGKKFSDTLKAMGGAATRQPSRALVNMWARPPVPEVVLYNGEAEVRTCRPLLFISLLCSVHIGSILPLNCQ